MFYAAKEFEAKENGDDEVMGSDQDVDDGSKSDPLKDVHMIRVPDQSEPEERTFQIVREPGLGLGMSISGGIGSTPYVGNDQVTGYLVIIFFVYSSFVLRAL